MPVLKENSASYLDWLSGLTLEFLFSWTGINVYYFPQVERVLFFVILLMSINHVVSMVQSQVIWQPDLKNWELLVSTIFATSISFIAPSIIALVFPTWASVSILLAIIIVHSYLDYLVNAEDELFQASRRRHRAVAGKMLVILALGWIAYTVFR